MANPLLTALRAQDKTGHLFDNNSTFVAYKTGFPSLDYSMGFNVNVFNKNGKIEYTYPALGITTGSIVTIVGGSHVGKSNPIDTPVPTPDGWKLLGNLNIGDYVFNRYGKPIKVLGIFDQGELNVCRVTFEDGRQVLCNDEHLWACYTSKHNIKVVTTGEMIEKGVRTEGNHSARYVIPITKEVEYPEKEFPIHPYVIGAFIGNGCMTEAKLTFSSNDIETVEKLTKLLGAKQWVHKRSSYSYTFELPDDKKTETRKYFQVKDLFGQFTDEMLKLSSEKHIPKEYLLGSVSQRYDLLRGLLDTDGSIDKTCGAITYSTTSWKLVKDIRSLCNSLGIKTTYAEDKRHEKYRCGHCYTVYVITNHRYKEHLFSLKRKQDIAKSFKDIPSKYITDRLMITKVEDLDYKVPMRCIYVDDPDHLFLINDYIVTHNTSLAIQMASNIVRPFESGTVFHYDLEGGTNMTRIANLSKFKTNELEDKYILRQFGASMEEIKKSIAEIYLKKTSDPSMYMYDTGLMDEFGKPITTYQPTCIIIDAVPSLSIYVNENTKDGIKQLGEISTQTDRMRVTAEIGRFLTESMQMMKACNIIMFLINHIKSKPSLGFPQPPELPYLKQDETLPSGKALQYYTNTLFRITRIGAEKYTPEEHGFDGFGTQILFVKNRTNVNGIIAPLTFDKVSGYDSIRSSVMYAKDIGMLGGNKNGYYFVNNKDQKFRFDTIHQDFRNNKELYKIMYAHIIPDLETRLSTLKPEEMEIDEEQMDYMSYKK